MEKKKGLCVIGSWPSAAPAISIPCLFWIIHCQMSQSLPGLKLGLVLELVMLTFEMNGKMPTDFSTRKLKNWQLQSPSFGPHPQWLNILEVVSATTVGLGHLWQTTFGVCFWNKILIYQPLVMRWPRDFRVKAFLLVPNGRYPKRGLWIKKTLWTFKWSKSLMIKMGVRNSPVPIVGPIALTWFTSC